MDAVMLFHDALQGAFGALDWLPEPDGTYQRFHVPGDKAGTRAGWYVLHLDGIASGAFGSWKTGALSTWSSRRSANPLEAQLIAQRIAQARHQREAEQHQRQQQAAEYAARLWRDAHGASPAHPYLIAKGCRPHSLRQRGNELLIPLYANGVLANLQRIRPDGTKRFLFGGMVKGTFSPLGSITTGQPLYVCEGWATGATLHEHSGAAVACAMNAGNLMPVALVLRARHPTGQIIIAGDDDRMTEGNPGRTAASAAAALLGCGLVLPPFPANAPLELSDFNDLANWRAAQ